MYESEVNRLVEPLNTLPAEVVERFTELTGQIEGKTILPWGEHCTECNWPVCYTTCELYSPRVDGGCRLFVEGTVRLNHRRAINPYLLKIRFKRWGKLWALGNVKLLPRAAAVGKEKANMLTGAVARSVPLPGGLKARVLGKLSYFRRRAAEEAKPSSVVPDCFLLECYNPNDRAITLTFSVRSRQPAQARPFQQLIPVPPGFAREKVPLSQIARAVDLAQPFDVEIVPNEADETLLYFGCLDFVKIESVNPATAPAPTDRGPAAQWKCIVWDLDNTLWDGILVEDGPDKIRVRQDVIDVIKETDRRGILHSIASKNNSEDALKILQMCGIDDYFLYPQINWKPKSESIARIVQLLNIGSDSLAFVDDQPFERAEVKSALPQVALLDAAEFKTIPVRAECQVPVTEESRQRRILYRQQQQRNATLESYNGDYTQFLKECDIRLMIGPLTAKNQDRVYELAQRTNQMNFSGNRYPRTQLQEIIRSSSHATFVVSCTDRFGSYGIVGFGVVDVRGPRLVDLMFSCRIQAKRVEHAFLSFLLKRYVTAQTPAFYAEYRRTAKNQASGKVFEEMGFEPFEQRDGVSTLIFRHGSAIADDGIVRILEQQGD